MKRNFGSKFIEVAINVPSGKIVFGNDFRQEYPEGNKGERDINHPLGRKQVIQDYASAGLLHGCVGNTCPGVYQQGNKLYIGRGWKKGKEVGSICTDLWWYSFADYDDFVKRGGIASREIVVKVTPGRYILKHRAERVGEGDAFATIERSDAPLKDIKMPEEGVIEALTEKLSVILKSKKTHLYIERDYLRVGEGWDKYKFLGYKIWGFVGGIEGEYKSVNDMGTLVSIKVQEKELKNCRSLLKKLEKNYRTNKLQDEVMREWKKEQGNKPIVISKETKKIIKDILDRVLDND